MKILNLEFVVTKKTISLCMKEREVTSKRAKRKALIAHLVLNRK